MEMVTMQGRRVLWRFKRIIQKKKKTPYVIDAWQWNQQRALRCGRSCRIQLLEEIGTMASVMLMGTSTFLLPFDSIARKNENLGAKQGRGNPESTTGRRALYPRIYTSLRSSAPPSPGGAAGPLAHGKVKILRKTRHRGDGRKRESQGAFPKKNST